MPKYQGREITVTVQANTKGQLGRLISGIRRYAQIEGLERIQVVQMRKDPDGGWEAIVRAHNWNPLRASKEKWVMRLTPDEKLKVAQRKLALKKSQTSIKLETIQIKSQLVKAKQQLAHQKLELARTRSQSRALGGGTFLGRSLFPSPHEPTPRKRKKAKKRQQPIDTLGTVRL